MKSFESKNKKIIDVLLNTSDYLTLEKIAQSVGLSKRSIQNHLGNIDRWIENNGLRRTRILRKQGQGVKLSTNVIDRSNIDRLLSGKGMSIYKYDNTRRLEIIKKLIFFEEDITIKSLAEQFHVTRQMIVTDIEWVKEWLHSYRIDIYITPRKYITIQGNEVFRRNAIAGYFYLYGVIENMEAGVGSNHERFSEKNFQNLINIFSIDTVERIKKIIETAEKKYGFFLNGDYYVSLITHIVIGISRLMNGNTVSLEFTPQEDEKFPEYIIETAEYIAKCIEDVFNVAVPEIERNYICIHLLGFNAISTEQSANTKMPKEIVNLAMKIIKNVDTQINTDFINDNQLFFGLCLHLKSTFFRIQRNVYHKKTSDFRLPNSGIDIYNAVVKTGRLYRDICGIEPDEEEILSVTYYFLLSLRRNSRKPKALLIYNGGIIERMKFIDMIEKIVAMIDVTNCCTIYQLNFLTLNDYDCVISTQTIELPDKPVIDLSGIDSSDYNKVITDFLTHHTI